MKKIYLAALAGSVLAALIVFSMNSKVDSNISPKEAPKSAPKYTPSIVPQNMSVSIKKERFYALVEPAVQKVYTELMLQYEAIDKDIKAEKNSEKIEKLKAVYKVTSNEELLKALKPHPQSIALAQAAMESSWATSRFFVQANNIFGMWSVNEDEPRIAASVKRNGTKTIWLKKFESVEDSVRSYYKLLARGKAYKEFRTLKMKTNNPHELVKKLDKYSEIGAAYGKELSQVIRYNKLSAYDH